MHTQGQLALVADIHGNLEALDAVLADLDARAPAAAIVCAGDVVGYGPDPWDCLYRLRARGAAIVRGNHEEMVLRSRDLSQCVYAGILAVIWTRRRLAPDSRAALEALPPWLEASPGVVICHGDLESAGTYVSSPAAAREALDQLAAVRPGARVLVCGNTHRAMFYGGGERALREMRHGDTVTLRPDEPCVINPGAVGQARRGPPLACYALLDLARGLLSYHAIPYDHGTTLAKLRSAGLVPKVVMDRPSGLVRRVERLEASLVRWRAERERRPVGGAAAPLRPAVTFTPPGLRRRAAQHVQRALSRVGVDEVFARARHAHGAMILTYHGISSGEDAAWMDPRYTVPAAAFAQHMEFLARHRRVISLDALIEAVERGERPAPGSVVITFDDGYRSTLSIAAPILKRLELPATLYLSTGYVERAQSQFVDVLYGAFGARTRNVVRLVELGPAPVRLDDPRALRQAYGALQAALTDASRFERRRLLDRILDQLRPGRAGPRLTLTWDEARTIRERYGVIQIGVHTREHVDLRRCSREATSLEVLGSIVDVRRELGIEPRHISFPFGRADARAQAAARDAGLRSDALAGTPGLVSTGVNLFALPRTDVPADLSLFCFYTSGAYPSLSLSLAGRTR